MENPDLLSKQLAAIEWFRLTEKERKLALKGVKNYSKAYEAGVAEWIPASVFLREKVFLKYQ